MLSRRRFLVGAAGVAGATMLAGNVRRTSAAAVPDSSHLVWVWQFNVDGEAARVRDALAQHGLGIILKTHDGTRWMTRWDDSPLAIEGATTVRQASTFFEQAGVPFHAWCVVQGYDPIEEARMCAEVLANGARSMTIDLEPPEDGHYWQASKVEALAFGRELRRLVPGGLVTVAPDPRPWQLDAVPMTEFASFSNAIAPQTYWDTFSTRTNREMLLERGFDPGESGVSPELILDVSQKSLAPYQLPIRPVGQGSSNVDSWQRFVEHSQKLGMPAVSVWRYGTMASSVLPLLDQRQTSLGAAPSAQPFTSIPVFAPPGISAERLRPASVAAQRIVSPPKDLVAIRTDFEHVLKLDGADQHTDADLPADEQVEHMDDWTAGRTTTPEIASDARKSNVPSRWRWVLPERPSK